MYNDNSRLSNNLANGKDTLETIEESPYLSEFLKEIEKLSKSDKKANYEYLEGNKKWLDGLPKSLSEIETKKRLILNAYLIGALATRDKS